ncbi:MAG: dihydrolipoyl dehydrogenase, partial [Lentisphaerae bacterium]
MERYDLAIIGAGPGGYVAAERAGHRGLKTVIIEKSHLGGVCLNEGCIPSKALLKSAKLFHELEEAAVYGVKAETLSFDLTAAMKRKTKIIETLRKGVAYQMRQNHVDVVEGHGRLTGQHEITVGDRVIGAEHIIIATGSSPIRPPIPGADQAHVLTSSELFQIEKLPENLVIVGGGVIGMEFACFFSSVGVNVTVIEMLDEVLPPFDAELAQGLRKALKKVKFILGARVENITGTTVEYRTKDADALESVPADMVLLSVGRKPNSADLGLEQVGIAVERGAIVVDERLQTNVPGIYA